MTDDPGAIVRALQDLKSSQEILQTLSGEPPIGPIVVGTTSTPLLPAVASGKFRVAVAVANGGSKEAAFVWGTDATMNSPLRLEPGEETILTPSSQESLAAIVDNSTTTITLIEFLTDIEG